MAYQGRFIPKNLNKYEGDYKNIYYRSSWELRVMSWCDMCEDISSWSSETVVVPYLCPIDGKVHRYFVDFKLQFSSGRTVLMEIKPEKQTKAPRKRKKLTESYVEAIMTYQRNIAKWKSARAYAEKRGWTFMVWTEATLNNMGIRLITK